MEKERPLGSEDELSKPESPASPQRTRSRISREHIQLPDISKANDGEVVAGSSTGLKIIVRYPNTLSQCFEIQTSFGSRVGGINFTDYKDAFVFMMEEADRIRDHM